MIRNLIRNKTILAVASIIIGVILIVRGRAVVDTTIRVFGYVLLAVAVPRNVDLPDRDPEHPADADRDCPDPERDCQPDLGAL